MLNREDRAQRLLLSVDITLNGAAFAGDNLEREVASMLRDAAQGIEAGRWLRTANQNVLRRPLRDTNGNTCGVVMFYRTPRDETPTATCKHCGHGITYVDTSDEGDWTWVAPDAGTDVEDGDGIWRETCPDNHESREAPHEPEEAS